MDSLVTGEPCDGICKFACFLNNDSLHVVTIKRKCPCKEPKLCTIYNGGFLLNSDSKLIHEIAHVCMEAFYSHWRQIQDVFNKYSSVNKALRSSNLNLHSSTGAPKNSTDDTSEESNDLNSVLNNLNSIALLICAECQPFTSKVPNGFLELNHGAQRNGKSDDSLHHTCGPLLSALIKYRILERCSEFCAVNAGSNADSAKVQLLNIYRILVSQAKQPIFIFEAPTKAILNIISECRTYSSPNVECILLSLLYDLSWLFSNEPKVFKLFSQFSLSQSQPDLLPLSILVVYMYRDNELGELARKSIYLIFSAISLDYSMIKYVSEKSCFCPVLATGISGTYSSLPTILPQNYLRLPVLYESDCTNVPYLSNFMQAVQFCNSLCNISHKLVRESIADFILAGFLCPIILPSISQASCAEAVASTAYLDFFLRTISESSLMRCAVNFVLTTKVDSQPLINLIISRINNPDISSQRESVASSLEDTTSVGDSVGSSGGVLSRALSVASLCFIATLVNLKSEDVMLELFLRFLLPCDHILTTQRPCLAAHQADVYGKSVEKFLALIPSACRKARHRPLVLVKNTGRPPVVNLNVPVQSLSGSVRLSSTSSGKVIQRLQRNISAPQSASLSVREKVVSGSEEAASSDVDVVTLAQYETSYFDYLADAKSRIEECYFASTDWNCKYNTGKETKPRTTHDAMARKNFRPFKMQLTKSIENIHLTNGNSSAKRNITTWHEHKRSLKNISAEQFFEELDVEEFMRIKADVHLDECNGTLGSSLIREKEMCEKIDSVLTDSFEDVLQNGADVDSYEDAKLSSCADISNERPKKLALLTFDSANLLSIDSPLPSIGSPSNPPVCENQIYLSSSKSTQSFSDALRRQDIDLSSSMNSDRGNFSLSLGSTEAKKTFKQGVTSPTKSIPNVYMGPCFAALFAKLEAFCDSDFHLNLVLTGVFASLVAYPMPLLKSYLLNPNMLFQPSVKTLYTVLQKLRSKVDQYAQSIDNFQELLLRGRYYFANMERFEDVTLEEYFSSGSNTDLSESGSAKNSSDKKFPTLMLDAILRRRKSKSSKAKGALNQSSENALIDDRSSLEDANVTEETRNCVMAVILMEEFVKELAAFCQEHSVCENN